MTKPCKYFSYRRLYVVFVVVSCLNEYIALWLRQVWGNMIFFKGGTFIFMLCFLSNVEHFICVWNEKKSMWFWDKTANFLPIGVFMAVRCRSLVGGGTRISQISGITTKPLSSWPPDAKNDANDDVLHTALRATQSADVGPIWVMISFRYKLFAASFY